MSAIPAAPSTRDSDHGLCRQVDWGLIARELNGLNVITTARQRKQLSKDFYWYSPILTELLGGCVVGGANIA